MKDNFENKLKDVFNQHEESVDNEMLWAGISDVIEAKKKRPKWLLLLLLPFMLASSFYTYKQWDYTKHSMRQSPMISEAKNPQKTNAFKSGNDLLKTTNPEMRNTTVEQNISEKRNDTEQLEESNSIIQPRSVHQVSQTKEKYTAEILNPNHRIHHVPSTINTILKQETLQPTSITKETHQIVPVFSLVTTPIVLFDNVSTDNLSVQLTELKNNMDNHTIEPFQYNKYHLFTSFSLGQKSISDNTIAHSYSTHEKYEMGFDYSLYRRKNLSLSLGLNYNRLVEEFSYQGSYVAKEERDVLDERIYYKSGEVTNGYDLKNIEVTVDRQLRKYPTRSIVSLPIGMQYDWTFSGIRLNAYAQYYLSYQLKSTVYLIDENNIPYSTVGKAQFLNSPYKIGLAFEKLINETLAYRLSLFFQQLNFNSNSGTNDISHHNQYIGISGGITF